MATDSTSEKPAAAAPKAVPVSPPSAVRLKIAIHDSSTFEWRLTLPLPEQGEVSYQIESEFELPETPTSRTSLEHLRGLTRLVEGEGGGTADDSLDGLRRQVLGLTKLLKNRQSSFTAQCAAGGGAPAVREVALREWMTSTLSELRRARQLYAEPAPRASAQLLREKLLADEFVSVRVLDLLGDAQADLDGLEQHEGIELGALSREITEALDAEIAYRRAQQYPIANASDPVSLEHYVERAGRLKKHFREVLALDREAYLVDERVQAWMASFGALVAGITIFLAQGFLQRFPGTNGGVGMGLVGVTLLTGLVYGARERIKDLSRSWITGTVYRFYAQRVVRCRLPTPRFVHPELIVSAREWCSETVTARPDPLNPESGAAQRFTLVHHKHRGVIAANHELRHNGITELTHVFRYDISALLPLLSDTHKQIAAVDESTGRARFVDAARRYYVPIRLKANVRGKEEQSQLTIVLDKEGVQRLEAAQAAPEALQR